MTEFTCVGFLFFMSCQMPVPTAVNNFAQECRIIQPSRQDTAETLRQVATENARCRAAKAKK